MRGRGNRRPHGSRAITRARGGSAEQRLAIKPQQWPHSSHGYYTSQRYNPREILYQVQTSIPTPPRHTLHLFGSREELLTASKKHFFWTFDSPIMFGEKWQRVCHSRPLVSSPNNRRPPLMALITGICQGPYRWAFSCLCKNVSLHWRSMEVRWPPGSDPRKYRKLSCTTRKLRKKQEKHDPSNFLHPAVIYI